MTGNVVCFVRESFDAGINGGIMTGRKAAGFIQPSWQQGGQLFLDAVQSNPVIRFFGGSAPPPL